ncbi:MAG: acetyl-CoA carboxylase biotin carboxyl carrier protein [Candidatus Omnitrophica bacterium]|nr:acetyl-CoA carboxylase biotin carboxyl carrier protein [Candidatus Omnitrophota bacterium]
MEPEELKKYVDFMKENGLTYLEVRKGDFYLVLQAGNGSVSEVKPLSKSKIFSETEHKKESPSEEENLVSVKSPLIGTFYRAPSPHSPPFVELGSIVKKGTTLCIVEAMKVMNEIKADCTGRIKKILVENGSPVEYGQILFLIEPLSDEQGS